MRKSVKFTVSVIAVILVVAVLPSLCGAQTGWQDRDNRNVFNFETYQVSPKSSMYTFWTTAMFLSGRYTVVDNVGVVAELPVAHSGIDGISGFGTDVSASQWMIGNPYLGIDLKSGDGALTAELGFRPPLGAESKYDAALIGTMASLDRPGAFIPNAWSLSGMIGYRRLMSNGVVLQVRGGPVFLDPTDRRHSEAETYLHYAGRVGYQNASYSMLVGLSGLYRASSLDGLELGFAERSIHSFEAIGHIRLGSVQPGLRVVIPLDKDQTDVFDAIYGLNIGFLID
jgi:hypothetical protein